MTDEFDTHDGAEPPLPPSTGNEPPADSSAVPQGSDGGAIIYSASQRRRGRDLLTRLSAVRRASRFYSADHPAVLQLVDAMYAVVVDFHDEGVDIHLTFHDGEVLLGERILTEESIFFDQLVRDMSSVGIGSLAIDRGVTVDELRRAAPIFGAAAEELAEAGGLSAMIADAHIPHIRIGECHVVESTAEIEDLTEEAQLAYGEAVSLMREIDRLLRANRAISPGRVKGAVRSLVDNVVKNRFAMLQLTGLKNYDEYTFYHSANVAILSIALGSLITTDFRFLSSLGVGAILHDIGKLAVDERILNKPGALTPEEWASVRQHPVQGAELTAQLPGVDKSAIVTILEHHMRFDATGYPQRVPPRRQHLASRIVAVADSYDAMTSQRSYSAARVQDEAMLIIAQSAGSSLDPTLVRLFISLMGVYPPRTVVRLSSGQVGIVLQPSETDPRRPVVRVIADAEGTMAETHDLDLMSHPDVSVEECLDPRLVNIEVEDYL